MPLNLSVCCVRAVVFCSFKLSELPQIAQVLEVSAARVSDPASSFVPPVVSLIELCAKVCHVEWHLVWWQDASLSTVSVRVVASQPFVIEKANQQYNSAAAISGLLQSLARMLSVNSPIVQQAAMDVLLAFASAGDEGAFAHPVTRSASRVLKCCVRALWGRRHSRPG